MNVRLDQHALVLERMADDLRIMGYEVAAELAVGMASAFRSQLPQSESPIAWTLKMWGALRTSRPPDAEQWSSMLLFAAGSTLTGRSDALKQLLFGLAAGIEGRNVPPSESSPAWRMGMKAVLECRGAKQGDTQLVVQIDPDPIEESSPRREAPPLIEPIEENTTEFDENTTPFNDNLVDDKTTPWIGKPVPPPRIPEPDACRPRRNSKAPANEEDLTKPKNLRQQTTKIK